MLGAQVGAGRACVLGVQAREAGGALGGTGAGAGGGGGGGGGALERAGARQQAR